ncbi:MAG: hypothetical protein M1282_01730 [Chloroflexi bacterium]|nr:hypothetical protein [Chloroflexota bacterium]
MKESKVYEHFKQPLASRKVFVQRLARNAGIAAGIVLISLGIGVLGYHFLEGLSWIDSLLNASMILGGMGPVDVLHTTAGKLFASFYALYSGVVLLAAIGVLAAPIVHRFMHHFHLVDKD